MKKFIQELKETWTEFCDWVGYVRNYKEHIITEQSKDSEAKEFNKKIEKLKDELKETMDRSKIKDELLEKAYMRIASLNSKISELMKERKQKNG